MSICWHLGLLPLQTVSIGLNSRLVLLFTNLLLGHMDHMKWWTDSHISSFSVVSLPVDPGLHSSWAGRVLLDLLSMLDQTTSSSSGLQAFVDLALYPRGLGTRLVLTCKIGRSKLLSYTIFTWGLLVLQQKTHTLEGFDSRSHSILGHMATLYWRCLVTATASTFK